MRMDWRFRNPLNKAGRNLGSIIPATFHWKQEWTGYAILVILLRLMYAAFGAVIVARGGPVELNAPIYAVLKPYLKSDLFSQWLVNPWFQWDTVSYFKIAMSGYSPDASIAFMPLYPLLIRFATPLFGGNYLLAALLLSTLFCFITLVLLFELLVELYQGSPGFAVKRSGFGGASVRTHARTPKSGYLLRKFRKSLYQEQLARKVVMLFIAFPTAFYLLAGYTESLFMMLLLAFWILARKRRWGWAALLAGLATLARLQAVVLAPVMLWMMLVSLVEEPASNLIGQLRQVLALFTTHRKKIVSSGYKFAWLATLTPVAVAMLYQAWLYNSGLGVISSALEKYWLLETVMPWEGLILFFKRLLVMEFIYMDWVDLALFVIILVASVIGLRLLDPAFSLYVWLTLAVLLTRGTPPHLLASYSRYFIALFPLFILPALIRNQYVQIFIVTISFFLQALLVWIFLWGSWVA